MPGEVHQPGLGGLLLVTATGSTKVERSGADLIGTVAVDRTEDVLMLFRYTENPPEITIFAPAALRVSAGPSGYTENSSFRYTGVKGNLRHFAGFSLSEEAISGPDKLQKTVPPPRGTKKGAIRDPSPRRNVAGGSAVG